MLRYPRGLDFDADRSARASRQWFARYCEARSTSRAGLRSLGSDRRRARATVVASSSRRRHALLHGLVLRPRRPIGSARKLMPTGAETRLGFGGSSLSLLDPWGVGHGHLLGELYAAYRWLYGQGVRSIASHRRYLQATVRHIAVEGRCCLSCPNRSGRRLSRLPDDPSLLACRGEAASSIRDVLAARCSMRRIPTADLDMQPRLQHDLTSSDTTPAPTFCLLVAARTLSRDRRSRRNQRPALITTPAVLPRGGVRLRPARSRPSYAAARPPAPLFMAAKQSSITHIRHPHPMASEPACLQDRQRTGPQIPTGRKSRTAVPSSSRGCQTGDGRAGR